MTLPRHIFREYDIRGVADRDLSDDVVARIGAAFTAILRAELGRAPRIALGRDGRLSSPRIHGALTRGMLLGGATLLDIGVGPSPLLYFAAHHLETDGAIHVTGSHNPGPDNGLKFMRGTASFFGADIAALHDRAALASASRSNDSVEAGSLEALDVSDAYLEAIRRASRPLKSHAGLRAVVDAGNGAAGPLGMRVLRALGFDIDPIHCEIDGTFPNHHPDPTVEENLRDLRERVLSTKATLGIAWDGDGDRIGVIDERGEVVWGDRLMILFSRAILREHPGATILGEVKCSETLFEDIRRHGGRALYSKTGHSLIKTKMKAERAVLAGEMSGHIFFADRYFGFDDAIYAAVRLLEIVGSPPVAISTLLADVPRTFATPEIRVDCADELKFGVVERVLSHYRALHPVLDIDGARVDFGDGAWGLCRASNTQPVLVLRFEANTESRLAAIRSEVESVVATASERR